MAATYYLDSAGDNSDGSTWAKAYTTLAGALAVIAANSGDKVYFRGTLAGANCQGTWGNAGSSAGRVYLIGCNAAGTEDGTRAVLDLNGAGTILTIQAKNCITIRNVTFRRATQGTTLGGTQNSLVLDNCLFELNSSAGLNASGIGAYGSIVRRCTFSNNTYAGCNGPNNAVYECCHVNNCGGAATTYGIYGDYIGVYGCVFVANTSANAVYAVGVGYSNYGGKQVEHCVFYSNKFGVYFFRGSQYQTLIFNKFLSNTTGINVLTGSHVLLENNGWNGNGAKYALAGTASVEAVTGEIDMAADGCVNAAGGNFNNSATSEGLFVSTDIDGTNKVYECMGLPMDPTVWEIPRNTDPGAANVLSATADYKILNVTKDPSYDLAAYENARNDVLNAAKLLEGYSPKTRNTTYAGLYHEASVSEVKKSVTYGPSSTYTGTYDPSSGQTTTDSDTVLTTKAMTRQRAVTKPATRTIQPTDKEMVRTLQITKHFR